jgi:hypothetical protein
MGLLKLWNAADTKRLYKSDRSLETYQLPTFFPKDVPTIEFVLLAANPSGGFLAPWSRVSVGTYSLAIGLFTLAGVQLAYQTVFTADGVNNIYAGTLTPNSPNMAAALTASSPASCYLEVKITDAGGNVITMLQAGASLVQDWIAVGTDTIPQNEIAASQSWVQGLFLPRDSSTIQPSGQAATFFIVLSQPGNFPVLCWADDDGQLHSKRA